MGIEDGYIEIKNRIRMGPIIHQTFDSINKVAIIAEFSNPGEIICNLYELDLNGNKLSLIPSRSIKQKLEHRPTFSYNTALIFKGIFDNLKHGVTYKVEFEQDLRNDKIGKFRVMEKNQQNISFTFASCNDANTKDIIHNGWSIMKEYYDTNQLDFIIHLGDQAYAHLIYQKSIALLRSMLNTTKSSFSDFYETLQIFYDNNYDKSKINNTNLDRYIETSNQIGELFDDLYRRTWNHKETSYILRNNLNFMIRDDNDIGNGVLELQTLDPISKYVAKAGYEHAKQKQLIDRDPKKEIYFEIGKNGFIFLDTRPNFETMKREKYLLDSDQKRMIDDTLNSHTHIDNLFIVSSVPIIGLSNKIVNFISKFRDDSKEMWEYSKNGYNNYNDQTELLDKLFRWKNEKNKNVTLIGGNLHLSGFTDICKGKSKINQVVSSPIRKDYTLAKFYGLIYILFKIMLEWLSNNLKNNIKVNHHNWWINNNFGLIKINNNKMKGIIFSISNYDGTKSKKSINLT